MNFAPPGNFYSPIPDINYIHKHATQIFDRKIKCIPGIELNTKGQCELLKRFSYYCNSIPFPMRETNGFRYYFENGYFSYGDAVVLYSMIRHFKPEKIIEIGSGFSSALMLDTNDRYFDKNIELVFIEPYPERLYGLLNEGDDKKNRIIIDSVQNISSDIFNFLNKNDLLFIDSSHIVKLGSDVLYLITQILPLLNKGVIVHFHDVFWPFEYPKEWVLAGRAFNESYFLKAFLQFNRAYKIIFFNSYLMTHFHRMMLKHLPIVYKNPGGSIWLQKNC